MADEAVEYKTSATSAERDGDEMENNNMAVNEALLPRADESREEYGNGGGGESAAGGRRSGGYWTAAKLIVAIFLLICVVAAVSFTAGQSQQRSADETDKEGWGPERPLRKLKKPTLILISADGFRWGYDFKVSTPNIDRLRLNGTEAVKGLIPVFPSLTYPNHYSIVTGLYPAWHGVIANNFSDPDFEDEGFNQNNTKPKWWGGEPIWVTATKNGLRAASYFWPGSEVPNGPWTCEREFCPTYNKSVPYEERVDTVLKYMDLPLDQIPSFISLYFESPDREGHRAGPDSPQVARAVELIDSLIGRLITGLEERDVFEDVSIILLGDHGMASTCDSKMIYLEDLGLGPELNFSWVDSYNAALLSIRTPPGVDARGLYMKMNSSLAAGKVKNSEYLKLYLKEDVPARFLYSFGDRIQPIIGLLDEGFKVGLKRSSTCGAQCGGQHGYDNQLLSMRTIFIGHGPPFARDRRVPSFINVEIYNIMTAILGLKNTAANNGTSHYASSVLLPPRF